MRNKQKTLFLAVMALLVAIEFTLLFTPLGYIQLGLMQLTILHIPVIIAALIFGYKGGFWMGLIFGLTSVIYATIQPNPVSFVFTPFISFGGNTGNIFSLVTAILPRILLGLITAYSYNLLKPKFGQIKTLPIAAFIGSIMHTILVLGCIFIFFAQPYAALNSVSVNGLFFLLLTNIGTNGILEALAASLLVSAIAIPLKNMQNSYLKGGKN